MLRSNPTQIRLESKDLNYYRETHNRRQAALANSLDPTEKVNSQRSMSYNLSAVDADETLSSPAISNRDSRSLAFAHAFPNSPPSRQDRTANEPLISAEPVPHNSRAFWDRILVEAGTPTRTQTTSSGKGQVIDPSDDWLDNNHSSEVSIEESNGDIPEVSPLDESDSQKSDAQIKMSDREPEPSSSDSFHSILGTMANDQVEGSEETNEPSFARRRRSFFKFRRPSGHGDPNKSPGDGQRYDHGPMDLDGPGGSCYDGNNHLNSDNPEGLLVSRPKNRHRSGPSSREPGADLSDGLYGNQRDRRTISSNLGTYANSEHDADVNHLHPLANEPLSRPRQLQEIIRRSSGLPRSPLYISQAASSSSAERRPVESPDLSAAEANKTRGLLALSPRRRKTYRPRSETYSYVNSEESYTTALPQLDGQGVSSPILGARLSTHLRASNADLSTPHRYNAAASTGAFRDYVSSPSPDHPAFSSDILHASPVYAHDHHPTASSPERVQIDSYFSHSSNSSQSYTANPTPSPSPSRCNLTPRAPALDISPRPTPSPHRSVSPLARRFISRSARRYPSPQLPLPLPFSATPRSISFASPSPSSPASPQTPLSGSLIPSSSPHTPPFRVYNDFLPASTQPRTTAGLRRNGVSAASGVSLMAAQNPFNTAPPRAPRLGAMETRMEGWQQFATPTRTRFGRRPEIGEERENLGRQTDEERVWRRQVNSGLRMGAEEREREREG